MKTMQQRMIGLGGADWKWAASLPKDETILAALCAELRTELIDGGDAAKVDDRIAWVASEQDRLYGTVRHYQRLTPGQRMACHLATRLCASKYLRSTGARLVNDITTRICFA